MAKKVTVQTENTAETTATVGVIKQAIAAETAARHAYIQAQKERIALEFRAETGYDIDRPFRFAKLENRVFRAVFDVKGSEVRLFREGSRKHERAPFDPTNDIYTMLTDDELAQQ